MDLRVALIGLLVGLLTGLSGTGSSALMAPLLILALRVNPLVAVGTDLAYSTPTKLLGALVHWRQGTIDRRLIALLGLGGLPGAGAGLVALAALQSSLGLSRLSDLTRQGVGMLLLVAAGALGLPPLVARLRRTPTPRRRPGPPTRGPLVWSGKLQGGLVALGALVGFVVSLTSLGSGSLLLPLLYLLLPRLGLRRLIGSDVVVAALLLPTAAVGHVLLGSVDVRLTGDLLVGALPGVVVGSTLLARLPDLVLRPALACVLLWAGGNLLGLA